MHGDEVDRCARAAPLRTIAVDVRRTAQPRRELRKTPVLAAPPVADGVAESAVPFAPAGGKPADLVTVHLADVPRFGDQLCLRNHRVLSDNIEEGGYRVKGTVLSAEGCR